MNRKTVTTVVTLILGAGLALAVEKSQPLEAHYQAARAALVKGNAGKAKLELKLSLQEDPLHAPSHFLLASLLGREGNLDQTESGVKRLAPPVRKL